MSGVNLDAIYQRLQSIPRYHPMSANTFADWAMEAGDIVTVKRDGTGYASPVGTMTLKWNGKQQIQISTEGSRERDSISKVSARKYARGAGGSSGIRSDRELYWEMSSEDGLVHASIHATEEYLQTDYSKKISDQNIELRGVVTQTAESLTSDYTKKIGDTNTELRGVITQTAESLTSDYTKKIGDTNTELRGVITQTAESLTSDYTKKIGDTDAALRGTITQTAASLTSDYSNKIENTNSRITQTADTINTRIANLDTRLTTQIGETDSTLSLAVGKVKYNSVQNYTSKNNFPATGTAGVLYHANDTGIDYLYMPGTHSYEKAKTDEYGNANFIKTGEIAISINESGDAEAKLDAKVVYAGANTKQTLAGLELPDWMDTTEGLIAEKATIVSLNALKARVGTLETDYLKTARLSSAFTNLGSASISELTADTMYIKPISGMGAVSVANAFTNAKITQDGNTYKLQALRFNSTSWEDIGTFSRATSLSGAWSGGELTVTASPQGATLKAIIDSVLGNGTVTYANNLLNVPLRVMGKVGSGSLTDTGYTQDFKVTPTAAFNAQSMSGSWSNGTATLKVSPGSASGTAKIDSVLANGAVTYDSENKILKVPLRVMGKIGSGSLTDTGYTQDFSVLAGDAYNAGWNAISSPSVTFTGLDGTISNKTDGTGRSTSFSLSMEKATYTPSPSVGAKDCVVVKTSGGTVVGRIDTSTTNTVTLTCDSIGDVSTDSEGNVYAKLNGVTKVTKQITLTRGGLKDDGTMALNAHCDGTRVARKWTSFNYAKLTADHKEGSKYYYTSTSNITSSNRIVCW